MKSTNRRCAECKKKVDSSEALYGGLKAFCCYECLRKFIDSERGQKAVRSVKRQDIKERKEKLKTAGEYTKEAQAAFNRFVRIRDAHQPCISCGNPLEHQSLGGGYDAGHYRSRGAASHLRFNLLNCHAQCKKCNRYLSGAAAEYRIGLSRKITKSQLEAIESDNTPRRFTIEYLKRVKSIFTRRASLYERLRNKKCCTHQ